MLVVKRLFLHCSATEDSGTVSWNAMRRWQMGLNPDSPYVDKPMIEIGYHFGLELVGDRYEVLVGRMLTEKGAHCHGQNYDSLGICFVGSFERIAPNPKQWVLGIRLVKSLMTVFNVGADKVFGHREFDPNKTCPGKAFNLDEFRRQLL